MNSKKINRNVLGLTLSLCLGVMFTHATGNAAEKGVGMLAQVGGPPGQVVAPSGKMGAGKIEPAQFGSRLEDHDKQLTSIEALFTRIESAKLPADKEKHSDDLDAPLAAYAKAMMESFDTAVKQAELANKSQGKEGSTELLGNFENLAKKHESRLKQLDQRAKKIMSPQSGSSSDPAGSAKLARAWPMLEKVSDFFVSPARAAIALSVYNACHHPSGQTWTQAQQTACNTAIANANSQGAAAHTTYNSCWTRYENTKPKWWKALQRAGCVTALVARLA
jgi:hypothetical protein